MKNLNHNVFKEYIVRLTQFFLKIKCYWIKTKVNKMRIHCSMIQTLQKKSLVQYKVL